jgi:hypothetical protein
MGERPEENRLDITFYLYKVKRRERERSHKVLNTSVTTASLRR